MIDMQGINEYWRQLSREEIAQGRHRDFVGGLWDEVGALQFQFMKAAGLQPHHKLLDIGCGALRGGIHFIDYLRPGNYYGLDINASLLEAGRRELELANLTGKQEHLLVNAEFAFGDFHATFDFALALSLFTHLDTNHILRCLVQARRVLTPRGTLYATFFLASTPVHLDEIVHHPGGITTHFDGDPFHYSLQQIGAMADLAQLEVEPVSEWQHPRDQSMMCFHVHHSGRSSRTSAQ